MWHPRDDRHHTKAVFRSGSNIPLLPDVSTSQQPITTYPIRPSRVQLQRPFLHLQHRLPVLISVSGFLPCTHLIPLPSFLLHLFRAMMRLSAAAALITAVLVLLACPRGALSDNHLKFYLDASCNKTAYVYSVSEVVIQVSCQSSATRHSLIKATPPHRSHLRTAYRSISPVPAAPLTVRSFVVLCRACLCTEAVQCTVGVLSRVVPRWALLGEVAPRTHQPHQPIRFRGLGRRR